MSTLEERFDAATLAVARAIFARTHPYTAPGTFDLLNDETREHYLSLARPEVQEAYWAFRDMHTHGDGTWWAGCTTCVNADLEPS